MQPTGPDKTASNRNDLKTIYTLLPYLWEFKGRVILALSMLILAKLANVSVPLILKEIVDALDQPRAVLVLRAPLRLRALVVLLLVVVVLTCSSPLLSPAPVRSRAAAVTLLAPVRPAVPTPAAIALGFRWASLPVSVFPSFSSFLPSFLPSRTNEIHN